MRAPGGVLQFGSARRQRHVSAAAALVVVLALVPCASAVYRSWWPEVPWCVKCTLPDPPGKWWNKCTYPKVLDEGVVEKGWKLIDFPPVSPEHPELWPNRPGDQEVLRQCKYIAFNSGLHDGIGSQYQRVMWLVAFAMKHNVSFVDLPLTYAQHGADTYEAFSLFNLGYGFTPFDEIPHNATICLAERCGPHQSLELKPAIAEKVRRGNFTGGPLTDFTWNKVLVAIHIRRGDIGDVTPREGRWVPDTFFEDMVRNMSSTLDMLREGRNGYEFHIFSEGQLNTTFANMSAAVAHLPVVWHLNGDPMRALRGIMCSDILVMAQSAFSFIAADWFTSATTIIVEPWTNWVPEEQEVLKPEKLPWTLYGLQERADGRQYLGGC